MSDRPKSCVKVPSSIMRKFIYKSGRTPPAQGREPALDYPIAEGRERVKGGEAACEAHHGVSVCSWIRKHHCQQFVEIR